MPEIKAKNRVWSRAASGLHELARMQPKNGAFVYQLRRLMREVLPVQDDVSEQQQGIYDEFTSRDDQGRPIVVGEGVALSDPIECTKRIRALLDTETTLVVEPLRAEALDAEGIKITPDLAYRLGPLLLDPQMSNEGIAESREVGAASVSGPPPE